MGYPSLGRDYFRKYFSTGVIGSGAPPISKQNNFEKWLFLSVRA